MSTLYLVATPIGNLGDITFRAVETLKRVDLILAEDTRKTKRLLSHYGISTPMESFHEHNEEAKTGAIIAKLKAESSLALVSDAGTPTLSDPGFKLVRTAVAQRLKVTSIPGPSAVIAALTSSGLPTDQFIFLGYFPKKIGKQQGILDFIEQVTDGKPTTVIFFESPYRIEKTLALLSEKFPEKEAVIARELTKVHEEITRFKLRDGKNIKLVKKGEFTILLR